MASLGNTNNHGVDEPRTSTNGTNTESKRLEPPPSLKNLPSDQRAALEIKLRRKIDLRVLPIILAMYILNYLDRGAILSAKLAGIEEDLSLTSVQYAVCA